MKRTKKKVVKTSFVTPNGFYKYTRMPFGLKNVPAMFQRAMNVFLATVKMLFTLFYIGDIITFSKSAKEHLQHIEKVLKLLNCTGMTINLKNFSFLSETIDFRGHFIAPGQLRAATKITEAVKALQYPTRVREQQSTFGLCNVYRLFVPNFAKLAAPLNKKL